MLNTFTAVFEQDGDWWVASVEELPGANTQGATLEEARENLKEAVRLVIEANRIHARRDVDGKSVIREKLVLSEIMSDRDWLESDYLSNLEEYEDRLARGEIQW